MKKFRAAVLVNQKQPLQIAEINFQGSLLPGQVCCKIHYSGICGSQLGEIDGVKGEDKFLPHLLGHEGSGVVEQIGPGVTRVSPGDSVVLHWKPSAGIQAEPPKYDWEGRLVNAGWVTTFNEMAVVSENRLTKIPQGSDMKIAALFGCAVTTGFGVVTNDAKVKIADSVLVMGAGGIGLNIIQAAQLSCGYPIIAVDLFENRLALAKKYGATHTINSSNMSVEDLKKSVRAIVSEGDLDVFIDNTGVTSLIEFGYSEISKIGKIVLVGVPKAGSNINIFSLPLHFGKQILGSHGGNCQPDLDIPRYMSLMTAGKVSFDDLISETFDIEDINTAISAMRDGSLAGRCMIRMGV
ncbi:zinc-binding dehydrogenase [Alphaproteobacteria bacterium]|nr:zinc-binding dehydrogenase [Alphaproteobacteria bacterium]